METERGVYSPEFAPAIAAELRRTIEGEVRFDAGSRAIYATDASNYRQVPIGVVLPESIDDIRATFEICRRWGAPILGRGAGTSLAGQCCNVAVVIDTSAYLTSIFGIDPERRIARVQPGVVLDRLREEAGVHGLTFGPDPATHSRCTIGGMIGNNSCGVHSVRWGKTDDNVQSMTILTYDGTMMDVGPASETEIQRIIERGGRRGEIYAQLSSIRDRYATLIRERFPKIPRAVSGYGLQHLLPENGFNVARALVGTESTCAFVLEATLRLVERPAATVLVVMGFDDVFTAADRVPEILEAEPVGLEGIDDRLVADMRRKHLHLDDVALLPEGGSWLLVEIGDESASAAAARGEALIERLRGRSVAGARVITDMREAARIWRVRESALGASAIVPGQKHKWEGWEDAGVAPEKLGTYLRAIRGLMDRFGYEGNLYGHFGDGCVHSRIDFDLESAEGIAKYRAFVEEAAHIVTSLGGSMSGEHGDGQARAELLPIQFGEELVHAFEEFKAAWDPEWKMNPGKVVKPYRLDENLRLGAEYDPARPETHFRYPGDGGLFANAALRCVGVGACRRESGGVMCPSWMVTRDETHSTRGRARLLFEMLQGDAIPDLWKDEYIRESLDLCLACKGCRRDCPVNVDMATYKAEFLSHYYEGRLRSPSAYAMGYVWRWARLASRVPRFTQAALSLPFVTTLTKTLAGIAPERSLPRIAPETFRRGFSRRKKKARPDRTVPIHDVILWPDTFTNYFQPEIGHAAVEVLQGVGVTVRLPDRELCCGRPLYDFGFLDTAKRLLRGILDTLREDIRRGTLIVGLEPSCIAVFRDELVNFFPDDPDARRLSAQVLTLAELLQRFDLIDRIPVSAERVIVQGHCHHRSVMGMAADVQVLSRVAPEYELLDSGCCGMAGAFGFESEHYDISVACAERELLPRLRSEPEDVTVCADGFSCREQISQLSNRRPLHLAELLRERLRQNDSTPSLR